MCSKERMTSRGKECDGSTKQKQPEKKNEKMGQERESWQLVEDGFACLYSSSVNPLIRAVGPGSRHLTGEEESPGGNPMVGTLRWVSTAHCSSPSSQVMAAEFLRREALDHEAPVIMANFRPLPSRMTPMGGGIYEGKTNTVPPSLGQWGIVDSGQSDQIRQEEAEDDPQGI